MKKFMTALLIVTLLLSDCENTWLKSKTITCTLDKGDEGNIVTIFKYHDDEIDKEVTTDKMRVEMKDFYPMIEMLNSAYGSYGNVNGIGFKVSYDEKEYTVTVKNVVNFRKIDFDELEKMKNGENRNLKEVFLNNRVLSERLLNLEDGGYTCK